MSRMKLKDIAIEKNERVDNPSRSPYTVFVGLEHYDSGEALIRRFGSTEMLESAMKVFHAGDILVARRNVYLKRAATVDFDGITSGDSIVLHIENESYRRIIPFVLNTDDFWEYANQHADGSMSKRLSPKLLMEYEFSIPDENLERFTEILWAIERTKIAYKNLLNQTDELVKSQFVEMFGGTINNVMGWPIHKLGEIYNIKSSKRVYANELTTSGVPFLKVADVLERITTGSSRPSAFISEQKYTELRSSGLVPQIGDILVTSRGTIGKCYIITDNDDFYFQDGMISWLQAKQDCALLPEFTAALFSEEEFSKALNEATNITTVTYISLDKLSELKIIIPPMNKQQEYLCLLSQIDKSKLAIRQALASLEKSRTAIMNKIFG